MNTSTPRTYAAKTKSGFAAVPDQFYEFARTLETELSALRAEVERLRSDRDCEKRLRKDADEFRENATERATKAEAELATATEECKNVRLKWHAVMGMCAAKEDAIIESDEELARLRARAERAEADAAAYLKRAESFRKIGDEAETELAKERTRTNQIATALTDAISTYFGADKLVTAERIEAWQAALKEGAK